MFCKVFNTEDLGQIMVMKDTGDNGPEVTVYFQPENMNVCSMSTYWKNDHADVQWQKCNSTFEMMTKERCIDSVRKVMNDLAS